MKKESDLRKNNKSLKLSAYEEETIMKNAKAANLSFSSFCIARAMPKTALTPEILIKIQNLVNVAYKIIQEHEPNTAEYIKKEMNEIWSFLN